MRTLPNVITLLRLALLPVLVCLTYSHHARGVIAAWVLFSVAAATDWLDGYLARRTGSVSRLGTILDPVVDKIVALSVLLVFVDLRLLPLWIVLLNMAREFLVTAARYACTTPSHVVGANWMGRTKFVVQVGVMEMGYLLLALRALGRPAAWGEGLLFWTTLGMTVLSWSFLVNFVRWHGLGPEDAGPGPAAG